jgi:hypothetical protein
MREMCSFVTQDGEERSLYRQLLQRWEEISRGLDKHQKDIARMAYGCMSARAEGPDRPLSGEVFLQYGF